jgi:hypothetical protein
MWYDVLEKYVYPTEQTSTKAVLAKTALDQVVYATIMTGGKKMELWLRGMQHCSVFYAALAWSSWLS